MHRVLDITYLLIKELSHIFIGFVLRSWPLFVVSRLLISLLTQWEFSCQH